MNGIQETAVVSPCTGICEIGRAGHCRGCGRRIDEIAGWSQAGRGEQLAIRERAARRLREHPEESS